MFVQVLSQSQIPIAPGSRFKGSQGRARGASGVWPGAHFRGAPVEIESRRRQHQIAFKQNPAIDVFCHAVHRHCSGSSNRPKPISQRFFLGFSSQRFSTFAWHCPSPPGAPPTTFSLVQSPVRPCRLEFRRSFRQRSATLWPHKTNQPQAPAGAVLNLKMDLSGRGRSQNTAARFIAHQGLTGYH